MYFLSLIQEAMLECVDTEKLKVAPENISGIKLPIQMFRAVLDEETWELMEMRHLMNNPKCRKVWVTSHGNELGRLSQGMTGQVEGTNTIMFINKEDIPKACW